MKRAELLSPAGGFESALAAFAAGADAVYCGLGTMSARAFAENFDLESLSALLRVAAAKDRKVYVAFNTILDEGGLDGAVRTLAELAALAPSGLIVQDLGVADVVRRNFPSLALHASTQLAAHSLEDVAALGALGFRRVVLARELSLDEISFIAGRCGGVELECFVHGALCHSVSGLCLFSAMEDGRSGNRGTCTYCCRRKFRTEGGRESHPFSMKDLRLGEDARRLAEAGVASLKIEGRMKSPLYVSTATAYYRRVLDGDPAARSAVPDMETVFARRATKLYFGGTADAPVDPVSIGHRGTPVGTVKRITKDRDGRSWLRFHTLRALERHDGLQFDAPDGGRPPGFGISSMRKAMSRANVFEVAAGTDVEILLPEGDGSDWHSILKGGETVYCSMSNAVRRAHPVPSCNPVDYPGLLKVDVSVSIAPGSVSAAARCGADEASASVPGEFSPARNPANTADAVRKAFSRLDAPDFSLGSVSVSDPGGLFVPPSVMNALRRETVSRLCDSRRRRISEAAEKASLDCLKRSADRAGQTVAGRGRRTLKLRPGQRVPSGDWDEIVLAVECDTPEDEILRFAESVPGGAEKMRLALPVYAEDPDFARLRILAKRLFRAGFVRWEAASLGGLRLARAMGANDVSADWTLYAFNSCALSLLESLGAGRFVASPENGAENAAYLAESGFDVEFLSQQSTPLFMSKTRPASTDVEGLRIFRRGALWVTVRPVPRVFSVPAGASSRIDLSWSPPQC